MTNLSIIIPVFNAEEYIEEFLISVLTQINSSVEVIIVNDGSFDKSLCLINDLVSNFSTKNLQIKIFSQNNQGLSSARNLGMLHASGKYFAFLDSDDFVDKKYVSSILNIINKYPEIDIIQILFNRLFKGKISNMKQNLPFNGFMYNSDKISLEIFNTNCWYACMRIFNRRLFEKLCFPEGLNYEDCAIVPELILKSETIYFLNEYLYIYRYNASSISKSKNDIVIKKNINSLNIILSKYFSIVDSNIYFTVVINQLLKIYLNRILGFYGIFAAFSQSREFIVLFKDLNNKNLITKRSDLYFFNLIRKFGFLGFFVHKVLSKINSIKERYIR